MHSKLVTGPSYTGEAKYIILPFEMMAQFTFIITTIWGVLCSLKNSIYWSLIMALFGRKISSPSVSEEEMKAQQKGYRNKELKEGEQEQQMKERKGGGKGR